MFLNLSTPPFEYPPSWSLATADRVKLLFNEPKPKVAWLYEAQDTSTFRYRVYNMVDALNADGRVSASWFYLSEEETILRTLDRLDVLVLCRIRYDAVIARIVYLAKRKGTRIIFDCDDLVFDVKYAHLLLHTLDIDTRESRNFDGWFAYIGRIGATAKLCDSGIATTEPLAEKLRVFLDGKDVFVIPNFLNRYQQVFSEQLLEQKRRRNFCRDDPLRIGYFSGSPSHNRDFAIVAPALLRILEDEPDISLRLVGFLDKREEFLGYEERIEVLPLQGWMNLQKAVAEVEISLAPLQNNEFTNCKSTLKFFEAAAVGTWTIASPTRPFRDSITDPATGYLALDHQWENRLKDAVALVRDRQRYPDALESAASEVYNTFCWDGFADCILAGTCY